MPARLLDGTQIARQIRASVIPAVEAFTAKAGRAPCLGIVLVGEMTSIGTLFAFMLVCGGVWIMRHKRPDIERGFTVAALPLVATLGILVCGAMIYGLGWTNWIRLAGWLAAGMVIYFAYGRNHSTLRNA